VYSKLAEWGQQFGISVSRPDGPTVKAVANGALAWHLDSTVASRVAKCHYGIDVNILFEPTNIEHCDSRRQKVKALDGEWRINGSWSSIVKKVRSVSLSHTRF
jgi:hypothetical protein